MEQTGRWALAKYSARGKVYLVVGNHEDQKPYAEAKALAGSNAKVTGTVFTRGGLTAIVVSVATTGVALALLITIYRRYRSLDESFLKILQRTK